MLLTDIIRIGQPIVESEMSIGERIQLLTDVSKDEVKNFYGNVFIVELNNEETILHYRKLQDEVNGPVNLDTAIVMPVTIPSGNPLLAQGIYPLASYPLYGRHINELPEQKKTFKLVFDRFARTIPYMEFRKDELEKKATLVADCLVREGDRYITQGKGVLYVVDHSLGLFSFDQGENHFAIGIREANGNPLCVDGRQIVDNIIQSRLEEAKELGVTTDAISTVLNEQSEKLVSAYNKGWLWLSHTWDLPASIYWRKKDWVKGIRLNRQEYEAFVYGAQFLKQVQTPIRGALLKEMFAPVFNVEAKQHMRPTSFETIYGIPYFLPITGASPVEMYKYFRQLQNRLEAKDIPPNALQLEVIGGLERRIIPSLKDNYRITIIYYSGILARGDIHIRGQIEDIVPSVAAKVQNLIKRLQKATCDEFGDMLQVAEKQQEVVRFRVRYLPALLSNAYGPGYLWSSMEKILNGRPIGLERVAKQTVHRITEIANKGNVFGVRLELLFYHLFIAFYHDYHQQILNERKGGMVLRDLKELMERYNGERLTFADLDTVEKVGFITGLLVQQFGRSYYAKVGSDYLRTRIMRFGSKLNPEMIWKNGLVKMEELRKQRDLGIQLNYEKALALTLPALLELKNNNQLAKNKNEFLTMFWSGYLMLPKKEKEIKSNESQ
ncbi:MAG: hypothetical protein HQP61_01170 [Peptococcaceae bacterium]|nr:hypothetical protein [Candidatus Syntrophopropionicum ammoniitolerans]